MRLFISYAHVDKPVVKDWIVDKLIMGGHDVWFDDRLVAGQDWKQQLNKEIQISDALVYCMTPESVTSEWCRWELAEAIRFGKPIIPVLLQARTEVPTPLDQLQHVDFSEGPTGDAVARLMHGLQQISPTQVPLAPTNPQGLPPQALEQDDNGKSNIILNILRDTAFQAIVGIISVIIAVVALVLSAGGNTGPLSPVQSTPSTPRFVAERNLDIREGPGTNFNRIAVLSAGDHLDILGISEDDRWYQVLLTNGNTGWIVASSSSGSVSGNAGGLSVIIPTATPSHTNTPNTTNLPTDSPTATNTSVPLATETPTQHPTKTSTTSLENTSVPEIISTSTLQSAKYPCEAQIKAPVGSYATSISEVRIRPLLTARLSASPANPLTVGTTVSVEAKDEINQSDDWYQIHNMSGTYLGWIQGRHLTLSDNCPN